MDKNFDGHLDKEELLEGLKKMGVEDYEEEANRILQSADFDNNGTVEFTEFCTVAMDKRKLLSDNRLKASFHLFDTSGNGKIDFNEIRTILRLDDTDNAELKSIIDQIDRNGDGEISYSEFKQMMLAIIK